MHLLPSEQEKNVAHLFTVLAKNPNSQLTLSAFCFKFQVGAAFFNFIFKNPNDTESKILIGSKCSILL